MSNENRDKEKDKAEKVTIIINRESHHLDHTTVTKEEFIELAGSPADYEVWKIVGSPDPEGELPKNDIQVTTSIIVKNGDRFRVVPPGTFGAMSEQLSKELESLKEEFPSLEVIEAPDFTNVIMPGYPLPKGYNQSKSQLLIKVPISYPNGKPDMFWLEESVLLENKAVPKSAEEISEEFKRKWRKFSWHASNWNPVNDNIHTYLEFINNRLSQAV